MEAFNCNKCQDCLLKCYAETPGTMSYVWLCPKCDKEEYKKEFPTKQNIIDAKVEEIINLLNECEYTEEVLSRLKNYIIAL